LLSGRNRSSEAANARHPAGISLVALEVVEDGNLDEFEGRPQHLLERGQKVRAIYRGVWRSDEIETERGEGDWVSYLAAWVS